MSSSRKIDLASKLLEEVISYYEAEGYDHYQAFCMAFQWAETMTREEV